MKYIWFIFLLVMLPNTVFSENTGKKSVWNKLKDEDGVIVYSQDIAGSDIIKVKTEVVINRKIDEIISVLDNAEKRTEWVPYLQESRIVKYFSSSERLEYSYFTAPWPASDRDFVYRLSSVYRDKDKAIYYMKSEVNELLPEVQDVVRADLIESQYILQALNSTTTRVELVFYADPKGWLPAWIINIIQRTLPYMMLRNLRDRLEDTEKDSHILDI